MGAVRRSDEQRPRHQKDSKRTQYDTRAPEQRPKAEEEQSPIGKGNQTVIHGKKARLFSGVREVDGAPFVRTKLGLESLETREIVEHRTVLARGAEPRLDCAGKGHKPKRNKLAA